MHLSEEQLVDIAEGTRGEASAPHLASCEACRRQLAELRAMMSVAAEADVPEPSPLFWNHFSDRVREAVAAEPARRGWDWSWARFRMPIALAAAVAILIIAVSTVRLIAPPHMKPPPSMVFVAQPPPAGASQVVTRETLATDDPSFALVTELTGSIDADVAHEAGLTPSGSADHAVTHLTDGELRELQRLLREALAKSSD
jgi:hypothetical protein